MSSQAETDANRAQALELQARDLSKTSAGLIALSLLATTEEL